MRQSYNHRYLCGNPHITDDRYQELLREEGVDIPEEDLFTPKVNSYFLEKYPDKKGFIKKRMALKGLLDTETLK